MQTGSRPHGTGASDTDTDMLHLHAIVEAFALSVLSLNVISVNTCTYRYIVETQFVPGVLIIMKSPTMKEVTKGKLKSNKYW